MYNLYKNTDEVIFLYIWLLLLIMSSLSLVNTVLSKKFQQNFVMDLYHFIVYNLINACFGSIAFFFLSGFSIRLNMITVLFALGYALIVALSLVLSLYVFSRLTVSVSSITNSSGSIITSSLFGLIFLSEEHSLKLFWALILMLLAVIFPFIKKEKAAKMKKARIFTCVLSFLMAGSSNVYTKIFSLSPNVTDANSFFFATNVVIVIFCALITLIYSITVKRSPFKAFNKSQLLNIGSRTVLSNIGSLLSIIIISALPISVYTIVTSSVALVGTALLSKLYFKEPMPFFNKLSVVSALLAVVIIPK